VNRCATQKQVFLPRSRKARDLGHPRTGVSAPHVPAQLCRCTRQIPPLAGECASVRDDGIIRGGLIAAVNRCTAQKQGRRTGVSAPHGRGSKFAGGGARATRFFLPTLFAANANKGGGATGGVRWSKFPTAALVITCLAGVPFDSLRSLRAGSSTTPYLRYAQKAASLRKTVARVLVSPPSLYRFLGKLVR
jgi:hypothetical protein